MMKIYLVRHGETDWNKQMLIQGTTDNPLNETGRRQAETINAFFEKKQIDIVVSSSLIRARETAYIATNTKPDIIDDRFIEREFGFFEGKNVSTFYEIDDKSTIENFEQDQSITERVIQGLTEYAKLDATIAIFAHSHVLKAALGVVEPNLYNFSSKIKNCAIVEFDTSTETLKLIDIH